jgi:cobalt-zinc-cadmium efflux system membrane fusion protein
MNLSLNNASRRKGRLVMIGGTVIMVMAGAWFFLGASEQVKKAPAAIVQTIVKEENFNTIMLIEETEQRIGLKTDILTIKALPRSRLYGGEIITPVGRRGVVTAPFGGILRAPPQGLPKEGDEVKKGQIIFTLMPLLTVAAQSASATAQVDAEMQAQNAATQLQAAKTAYERARKLFSDGVGAKRTVEETKAVHDTAAKTLEAAKARQELLEESLNEGTAAPILIAAPEDGVLRKVLGAHGQNVLGGTALFEMGDLSTAWVRVTMPVGDLEDIARDREAQVGDLSARANATLQAAMPVTAPPLANPQAFTVDILYVLHDAGKEAIPGQRVGVLTPLNDAQESLTLPASAIIFDALGGSWVYEQVAPHTYARRRVMVSYISGNHAVLSSGLTAGSIIVTVGAQSLFGAETGMMK